jgi:hypothetical protein
MQYAVYFIVNSFIQRRLIMKNPLLPKWIRLDRAIERWPGGIALVPSELQHFFYYDGLKLYTNCMWFITPEDAELIFDEYQRSDSWSDEFISYVQNKIIDPSGFTEIQIYEEFEVSKDLITQKSELLLRWFRTSSNNIPILVHCSEDSFIDLFKGLSDVLTDVAECIDLIRDRGYSPLLRKENFYLERENLKEFEQVQGIFDHGLNIGNSQENSKKISNIELYNQDISEVEKKAPVEGVKKRFQELKKIYPHWKSRNQFEDRLANEFEVSASTIRNRLK